MKKMMLATLLAFGMTGVAFAKPSVDTSAKKHPNINAAIERDSVVGLTAEQAERVYQQIDSKRRATRYLQAKPLLAEAVPEIEAT